MEVRLDNKNNSGITQNSGEWFFVKKIAEMVLNS